MPRPPQPVIGTHATWADWSVASDGSRFVVWTEDPKEGMTVWSLNEVRSTTISEPAFAPELTPMVSKDGKWLRYARTMESGGFEIVSRSLLDEGVRVEWQEAGEDGEYATPAACRFSSDGSLLCVNRGREIWTIRWDESGAATTEMSALSLPEDGMGPAAVVAVSDDGKNCLLFSLSSKFEDFMYGLEWVEMSSGTVQKSWGLPGMHLPLVHAAIHPAKGILATSLYVSGPSLGYYEGEVELPLEGRVGIPEYSTAIVGEGGKYEDEYGDVLPEDDPDGRKAHALAIQFLQPDTQAEVLLGIYANNGCFRTWNPSTRKIVHQYYWNEHRSGVYHERGTLFQNIIPLESGRVFLPLKGGGIRILKLSSDGGLEVLADLWSLPENGLLVLTPDGSYDCPEGAERHVLIRKGKDRVPLKGNRTRALLKTALGR